MKYEKPEVAVLGNASEVIEVIAKSGAPNDANQTQLTGPAYDLDE